MKNISIILLFAFISTHLFASTEYVVPAIYRQNIFSVEVKDLVSDKGEFKFAFTIENKSNDKFLVFELSKIAVAFSETEVYYPKNEEILVVNPNSKERRTVKVISNGSLEVDKINIEFPRMQVNGAPIDFSINSDFNTKAEQSATIGTYATATIAGFEFKKDVWNGELEVKTNTFEGMLIIDLTKISGKNASGAALLIEFKRDKSPSVALISNDKFKSKYSIADIGSTLQSIKYASAFKMYALSGIDIPEITVKKVGYVEPAKVVNKDVNLCESFSTLKGFPVKVTLFNPNGICFKVATNGRKINDNMCSNVEFDVEYGTNVLTIALSNGQTLTEKIYPSEGDVYIVYEIMERKGEWKLNRKLDLSGDARKTDNKTESTTNTVTCKDNIILADDMKTIHNLTIIKMTKDKIYFYDCNSLSNRTISKMDILGIEYANGYYDKFDFPGNSGKRNMDLERSESNVIELRNSTKTSSSFIIGPSK